MERGMPAGAQPAGNTKSKIREAKTIMEVSRMDEETLLKDLAKYVDDLAWDYDRFSESGKETYDKICSIVNQLRGG